MADDWRYHDHEAASPEWREQLLRSGAALAADLLAGAAEECGPSSDWESPIEHAMALAMCMLRKTRYRRFDLAGLTATPQEGLWTADDARETAEKETSRDKWFMIVDGWQGPTHETGEALDEPAAPTACVFSQVAIGTHVVDFLILHLEGLDGLGGVVVECDGHDYHERTKEQVARDRARDRDLQEQGYKVFRFTGSEIWRDAIGCADQALKIANDIARTAEEARALRWYMGRGRYYEWVTRGVLTIQK
jgi:very-short-patch-repair endonuclease